MDTLQIGCGLTKGVTENRGSEVGGLEAVNHFNGWRSNHQGQFIQGIDQGGECLG